MQGLCCGVGRRRRKEKRVLDHIIVFKQTNIGSSRIENGCDGRQAV